MVVDGGEIVVESGFNSVSLQLFRLTPHFLLLWVFRVQGNTLIM
jgi:hypothetical protein